MDTQITRTIARLAHNIIDKQQRITIEDNIPWYTYFVKNERYIALSDQDIKNKLIVCKKFIIKDNNCGHLFASFNSREEFFNYMYFKNEQDRNYFEVFTEFQPRKIYFDIDIPKDKILTHLNIDIYILTMIEKIYEACCKIIGVYSQKLDREKFLIFSSSNNFKKSFHIVIDGFYIESNNHCKEIFNQIFTIIDPEYSKYIDNCVYKSLQQFRLLYSQKPCSEPENRRPKIVYDENISNKYTKLEMFHKSCVTNIDNCIKLNVMYIEKPKKIYIQREVTGILQFITDLKYDLYDQYEFKDFKGENIVTLQRIAPGICPTCKRFHEHENGYLLINQNGIVLFNCRRSNLNTRVDKTDIVDIPVKKIILGKDDEEIYNENSQTLISSLNLTPDKILEISNPFCRRIALENYTEIAEDIFNKYKDDIIGYNKNGPFKIYRPEYALWLKRDSLHINVIRYLKDLRRDQFEYIDKKIDSLQTLAKDVAEKCLNVLNHNKQTIEKSYNNLLKFPERIESKLIIYVIDYCLHNKKSVRFDFMNKILPIHDKKCIDLSTGLIRDRIRDDFFTYELNRKYIYSKSLSGRIENMISSIFLEDQIQNMNERIKTRYFQRLLGYIISAEKCFQLLILCIGEGANGKSTLVKLLNKTFPEIFKTADQAILEEHKKGTPTPELIGLESVRGLSIVELDDNKQLDQKSVTSITGNDEKYIRSMYHEGQMIEFIFTLMLFANTYPILNVNRATYRRIVTIPMNAHFVDNPDPNNPYQRQIIGNTNTLLNDEILLNELFSWVIEGCIQYYKNPTNLMEPEEYKEQRHRYMEDIEGINTFEEFMNSEWEPFTDNDTKIKKCDIQLRYDQYYTSVYSHLHKKPKYINEYRIGHELNKWCEKNSIKDYEKKSGSNRFYKIKFKSIIPKNTH